MVYTKTKLKNHRENYVQTSIANLKISLKKETCILWDTVRYCHSKQIMVKKKNHIMGKILDILVYNLIKTVCSKSSLFGRQPVLKKQLHSVGKTL